MNANPGSFGHNFKLGLAKGLFWGWNIIFLAFILLGFAPLQLPELITNVRSGLTPVSFLVQSLVVIAIPFVVTAVAVLFLRRQPAKLFALGYVVEWPLLLILFFRFMVIRQGNPAVAVLLAWLAAAEAAFLWFLLDRRLEERPPFWKYLSLAGLTLLFAGTLYAAVWLLFYIPPLAVMLGQGVYSLFTHFGEMVRSFGSGRWYELPLALVGQFLLFFSVTLILIMPVSAPILAGRAWLKSLRTALKSGSRPAVALTALLSLVLVLAALAAGMRQPQQAAFQLLKQPPTTPQQAQALLAREEQIRAGLLNAYLASYRYLSSQGEVRYIKEFYKWTLNVSDEAAGRVEMAHEFMLKPFLYAPVHPVDTSGPDNRVLLAEQREAAELYQRFFDRPINKGELEEIVSAVRATSNGSDADLAWQVVDDREVHLNLQEVTVAEHGDWADVEIHEAYENRTFQRQEVVVYFSLPESAVITGLWLGNTPDRRTANAYHIAPRGAAQAVYRSEVRYFRDPALVEQIGPRQYRLRVFPVEPRLWTGRNGESNPGPPLHLWMTYRTVSVAGGWSLPRLAEKFNVFWDGSSTRTINGQASPAGAAEWFPTAVSPAGPITPAPHRVDFPDGTTILAVPADDLQPPALPPDIDLAVVLDRSFSMRERANEVREALAGLKTSAAGWPDPDIYLTSSSYRGEAPGKVGLARLNPDEIFYFGGQNAAQLLAQFEELSEGQQYDLILVLTDGNGYELGDGKIQLRVPGAPVWVVHLGGGFPLGYDDPTLEAIQASGGGAASTVEEALARWSAARYAPGRFDIVDGYRWETLTTAKAAAAGDNLPAALREPDGSGFTALAARRVILAEMARYHASLNHLPVLDQLHHLAVEQSIVTPYSSMIVLVNREQVERLEELSQQADRYAREVENIGQTGAADPMAVTGVPEPEEWLLIILAALALAYVARRRMRRGITTA